MCTRALEQRAAPAAAYHSNEAPFSARTATEATGGEPRIVLTNRLNKAYAFANVVESLGLFLRNAATYVTAAV